jgi:hypothetical protein
VRRKHSSQMNDHFFKFLIDPRGKEGQSMFNSKSNRQRILISDNEHENSSQSDQNVTDDDSMSTPSSEHEDHKDQNCIKTKRRLKKVKVSDSSNDEMTDEDLNCIKTSPRKVKPQQCLSSNKESSDDERWKCIKSKLTSKRHHRHVSDNDLTSETDEEKSKQVTWLRRKVEIDLKNKKKAMIATPKKIKWEHVLD